MDFSRAFKGVAAIDMQKIGSYPAIASSTSLVLDQSPPPNKDIILTPQEIVTYTQSSLVLILNELISYQIYEVFEKHNDSCKNNTTVKNNKDREN